MSRIAIACRAAAAGLVAALMLGTAPARADCPPLPAVPGLDAISAEAVIDKVETRYAGDWDLYLDIMRRFRDKVADLDAPEAASVQDDISARIEAVRCLAAETTAMQEDMAGFETATGISAGTDSRSGLDLLDVASGCRAGATRFLLVNRGGSWPARASVRIYRTLDGARVADRDLRLDGGESVALNVHGRPGRNERFDLAITADWDPGAARYATERCGS